MFSREQLKSRFKMILPLVIVIINMECSTASKLDIEKTSLAFARILENAVRSLYDEETTNNFAVEEMNKRSQGSCPNTRDNSGGLTCDSQLYIGKTCVNFLQWKDCDLKCNLCACSTATGTTSQHCSGNGVCTATCSTTSCNNARCNCNSGWHGDKCQYKVYKCPEINIDYPSEDISGSAKEVDSWFECRQYCADTPACKGWTYTNENWHNAPMRKHCHLKGAGYQSSRNTVVNTISGSKTCTVDLCPEIDTDYPSEDISGSVREKASWFECRQYCAQTPDCKGWTYTNENWQGASMSKRCYLKGAGYESSKTTVVNVISGSKTCTVNGNWGNWAAYTACSTTCGDGIQTSSRQCNDPPPAAAGKDCDGTGVRQQICKERECPVDGNWGEWGSFGACSKTCGDGKKTKRRQCNNPAARHGGRACEGDETFEEACKERECPIDGNWGEWGSFEACSKSCGDGRKTKRRQCNNPAARHGGRACEGDETFEEACKERECPIDGNWGEWGSFGACSKTCGDGRKTKRRQCNNPAATHGGRTCEGDETFEEPCKDSECPKWTKVGCFKETDPRVFPNLLANYRSTINWKKFPEYLKTVVRSCALLAENGNYKYFAIQFYGECWSGPKENLAGLDKSDECVGNDAKKSCDDASLTECAGKAARNYIYSVNT